MSNLKSKSWWLLKTFNTFKISKFNYPELHLHSNKEVELSCSCGHTLFRKAYTLIRTNKLRCPECYNKQKYG